MKGVAERSKYHFILLFLIPRCMLANVSRSSHFYSSVVAGPLQPQQSLILAPRSMIKQGSLIRQFGKLAVETDKEVGSAGRQVASRLLQDEGHQIAV
jgi:putative AlgH/UPF0301 family transcriptional regulator